ncbi:hypothetical protein [Lactiplantibacillus paraplantarum]|uniref:hypothetical protein n=1 Tax=Lactiplantibacillus paraplantarum TaxID=60520 RepID=UPI0020738D5B|nr:hypothetical protein [Lactiplantibacillus paraplantarum]
MKYETKIEDVDVKSNYPIDVERVNKIIKWRLPSWTKQVTIEGPLVDDDWEGSDTVGELINKLNKLPKDMPIEYNYAGMSVELVRNLMIDGETLYLHSALVVSEQ